MTKRGDTGADCSMPRDYQDDKPQYLVYGLVIVLFGVQVATCYTFCVYYWQLDNKYEMRFHQLEMRIIDYEGFGYRVKRDTGIQDNSVLRPVDEVKVEVVDNETAKNESTLTMDDIIHLRQNFSNEVWVWLNKYSRVPVRCL